ncbi:MAG: hypothetical protein R2813_10550 [Flavobacteriales bacterium]
MFYDFTVSLLAMLILVLIMALFSANPLEFTIIQMSAISIATLYQASPTPKKYDQDSMVSLVNSIVDTQRREAQFEEASVTLKDISEAKAVLIKSLKRIYHTRISYD